MGIYIALHLGWGNVSRMGEEEILLPDKQVIMGNVPLHPLQNLAAPGTALLKGDWGIPVYVQDYVLMGNWGKFALLQHPVEQECSGNEGKEYSPGCLLVPEGPFQPLFISVINAVQEGFFLPCRFTLLSFVQTHIIHRNHQYRHKQGGEQGHCNRHSLVIEQRTRNAAEENQRNKYRTGGENRAEHRGNNLPGGLHNSLL